MECMHANLECPFECVRGAWVSVGACACLGVCDLIAICLRQSTGKELKVRRNILSSLQLVVSLLQYIVSLKLVPILQNKNEGSRSTPV